MSVFSASSTWSSCTGSEVCVIGIVRAGGDRRRRRAAGLQFDEPVAFEEDPRADLQRRVAVDRQPLRFDFHRHEARSCRRARSSVTLPTSTPAMRTGDLGWMLTAVANSRLQAVAVFERDVLGEAEVHDQHEDHDHARSRSAAGWSAAARRRGSRRGGATSERGSFLPSPWLARPSALSVALEYFSPNRFCSRAGEFAVGGRRWPPAGCRSALPTM